MDGKQSNDRLEEIESAIKNLDSICKSHNKMFQDILNVLGISVIHKDGTVNFQMNVPKDDGRCGFLGLIMKDLNKLKNEKRIIVPDLKL